MQQRAVKTRQQILESAVRVFAEKGFSGATVDEIAEAAAVNKQRIYAYFGSKQGLFEAALLACFSEVELFSRKMLKEIAASPQRMTELLLGGFFAAHRRNPRFRRSTAPAAGTTPKSGGFSTPPSPPGRSGRLISTPISLRCWRFRTSTSPTAKR